MAEVKNNTLTFCCVPYCLSNNSNATLYYFPRNVAQSTLWIERMKVALPGESLTSLTDSRCLRNKRICSDHFEKKFILKNKRLPEAYPTLFTREEIDSGIPKTTAIVDSPNTDHVYAINIFKEHNYVAKYKLITPINEDKNTQVMSGININNDKSTLQPQTVESSGISSQLPISLPIKNGSKKKRLIKKLVGLNEETRNIYKECLKLRRKNVNLSNKQKLLKAQQLSDETLVKKLQKLPQAAKMLTLMQIKLFKKKKPARRYSLEENLLALSIYKKSPKAYRLLKNILILPSTRCLRKVTQIMPIPSGLNQKILSALKKKSENWTEIKRICSVVIDEVSLSSLIKYDEHGDKMYGFVDVEKKMRIADHALVVMVRGACSSWRQPIAYYFCEGSTPTVVVKNILKEVVKSLQEINIDPVAFICDQGGTFRAAMNQMQQETRRQQILDGLPCDDTIVIGSSQISVVFDPPHLLKGIRNNFLGNHMIFENEVAKWDDIVQAYLEDCELGDVRIHKKLTDQHVIPEKIKKMKVSYCAQVLSEKMAVMLHFTARFGTYKNGEPVSASVSTTAKAVTFFDKLFDSVNGSRSDNPAGKLRGPVKENSEHLEFWKEAKGIIGNIRLIDKDGSKKQIPSLKNWITTIDSMERIWKYVKGKGVKYFYTNLI